MEQSKFGCFVCFQRASLDACVNSWEMSRITCTLNTKIRTTRYYMRNLIIIAGCFVLMTTVVAFKPVQNFDLKASIERGKEV